MRGATSSPGSAHLHFSATLSSSCGSGSVWPGKPATGAQLHHRAVQRVRARSQASLLKQIESELTQDEIDLVRRGRNAKVGVVPKSARPVEHRLPQRWRRFSGICWRGEVDRLVQLLVLSDGCTGDVEDDE